MPGTQTAGRINFMVDPSAARVYKHQLKTNDVKSEMRQEITAITSEMVRNLINRHQISFANECHPPTP